MTALDQIELKKDQIRYKKVGKKYIVDNDPWAYEGLREGYWLVKVSPGLITIRQQIYPEKSAITAAARDKEEQLLDIIRTASEAQLYRNSLTPEALADWKKFIKKHGKQFNTLEYPSFQENAERIVEALLKS